MKRSTLFLRLAIVLMGLVALGLCYLILPAIYGGWEETYPYAAYLKYPVLIGLSATVIPFFMALYQTVKLLGYIDKNKAFSHVSTRALRIIKYCAFVFSGLYALGLPVAHTIARGEDTPALMIIDLIFTVAPLVIGVFAGVFQGLLQNAIDIKSENDLTV